MLPEEKVRLLSLVDVLEPLSEEEIAGLIQRIPSTHLEEGQVFYTPEDRGETQTAPESSEGARSPGPGR